MLSTDTQQLNLWKIRSDGERYQNKALNITCISYEKKLKPKILSGNSIKNTDLKKKSVSSLHCIVLCVGFYNIKKAENEPIGSKLLQSSGQRWEDVCKC